LLQKIKLFHLSVGRPWHLVPFDLYDTAVSGFDFQILFPNVLFLSFDSYYYHFINIRYSQFFSYMYHFYDPSFYILRKCISTVSIPRICSLGNVQHSDPYKIIVVTITVYNFSDVSSCNFLNNVRPYSFTELLKSAYRRTCSSILLSKTVIVLTNSFVKDEMSGACSTHGR